MTHNWPTPTDAGEYFRQEQKKTALEQRRPIFRRASDLVGPGIGASAVRVTDWGNTLATFNGYYASNPGAVGAPTSGEPFVGYTVMDDEIGGTQALTGMTSGREYTRTFRRNPADPEFITWGAWVPAPDKIAATMESSGTLATSVASGVATEIKMPSLSRVGESNPYQVSGTRLNITEPGVYTGHLLLSDNVALASMAVTRPGLAGLTTTTRTNYTLGGLKFFPLNFATTATNQYVSVEVVQSSGASANVSFLTLMLTRTSRI